jgi:hypothetical protein
MTLRPALLVGALLAGGTRYGLTQLPARAFLVEGGAVALHAGVMRNFDVPPGPSGESRYPTKYFVTVTNEAKGPVWADLEWRFPGDRPHLESGGRLEPGQSRDFLKAAWGVIEEQPLDIRISIYSDEGRTHKIGSEDTFLRFGKHDTEAFLENFWRSKPQRYRIVSGWPEMVPLRDTVPGAIGSAKVQRSIQLLLWKEESKQHRDCKHEIVRVEPAPLDSSVVLTHMLATGGAAADAARTLLRAGPDTLEQGAAHLERWVLQSCGVVTTYQVLRMTPPGEEPQIIAHKVAEEPGP